MSELADSDVYHLNEREAGVRLKEGRRPMKTGSLLRLLLSGMKQVKLPRGFWGFRIWLSLNVT